MNCFFIFFLSQEASRGTLKKLIERSSVISDLVKLMRNSLAIWWGSLTTQTKIIASKASSETEMMTKIKLIIQLFSNPIKPNSSIAISHKHFFMTFFLCGLFENQLRLTMEQLLLFVIFALVEWLIRNFITNYYTKAGDCWNNNSHKFWSIRDLSKVFIQLSDCWLISSCAPSDPMGCKLLRCRNKFNFT